MEECEGVEFLTGNLIKDLRVEQSQLLNSKPLVRVPLRYFMTSLAASMCIVVGFDMYLAKG